MKQEEIRIHELEFAVEANRTLLTLETEKAKSAFLQLIKIGHELGGISFDDFLKTRRLEDFSPEDLSGAIIGIVKVNLALQNPDIDKMIDLRREVGEKGQLADTHAKRAEQAEEIVRALKKQVDILENDRAKLRQEIQQLSANLTAVQAKAPDADPLVWFSEWKKEKDFNRNSNALVLIGETGWARTSKISTEGSERLKVSDKTIRRGIKDLVKEGLIECQRSVSTMGHPTDLVRLNDKGRWAYTKLTGKVPAPSEYDGLLEANKSDRQSMLILKAADLFIKFGYSPNTHPVQIKLDGNRHFDPDFIMRKDSETFYIEFETGIGDNRNSLAEKWENASTVGGGNICLVTRDKNSMNELVNNIVRWAGERGKRIHLFATHIEALKTLTIDQGPWVVDKDR
jgi:DNA-binding PadR family transcriptional regulator